MESLLKSESYYDVKVSQDQTICVAAAYKKIILFELPSLKPVKQYNTNSCPQYLSLSPDNLIVAFSTKKNQIFLLDLITGGIDEIVHDNFNLKISSFTNPKNYNFWQVLIDSRVNISVLNISPNNKLLATSSHSPIGGNKIKK